MTFGAVVVTWNGAAYLEACLGSLLGQTVAPRCLVVVDNASHDRSLDIIQSFASRAREHDITMIVIEEPSNTGFTRGANRGLQALMDSGQDLQFAVLLNQDAVLDPGWCDVVGAVFLERLDVAAVGSRILLPNRKTIQHAGGYLEQPRMVGHHYGHHLPHQPNDFSARRDVDYVTAAAAALRVSTLRAIGPFDEVFSPGYYEDVEWCARATTAGWKIVYVPEAVATHVESASFRLRPDRLSLSHRNRLVFTLPLLVDSTFRRHFAKAEREYLLGPAPAEDRRAIGVAYLLVLLMLPEPAARRLRPEYRSPGHLSELVELFGDLRTAVLVAT